MIRMPIAVLLLAALASASIAQTPDERRARLREAYLRAGSAADKEAILAEMRAMTAGSEPLDALLGSLRSGERGDAIRQSFRDLFVPLGMRESHEAMERIRRAGLLDAFLAAVLRSERGGEVDPTLRDGIRLLMETGRLDVYAEVLASTTFDVYDPATHDDPDHHAYFDPGANGIHFNRDQLQPAADVARTMAHEIFHAYTEVHGKTYGALDEAFGIAAIPYAFGDGDYDLAEMVYGTKNFARDIAGDPDYPFGNFDAADPELRELLEALSARDRSQVAWRDPEALVREYEAHWAGLDRNAPDWFDRAARATEAMLRGRQNR